MNPRFAKYLIVVAAGSAFFLQRAVADERLGRPLVRSPAEQIVESMRQPKQPGKYGIRAAVLTETETPDPDRPLPVVLPDGTPKYVMGLSGQSILMVDRLSDLNNGPAVKPVKIRLFNEHNIPYGEEPMDYSVNSSTWDASVKWYPDGEGRRRLKIFAGAMGDGPDGRPLLQQDPLGAKTRQRMAFDAEFELQPDGQYMLVGRNPQPILGFQKPDGKRWIETNSEGRVTFAHGYGGAPTTLENGEIYVDHENRAVMFHEQVVEERNGSPFRTAIVKTYLMSDLSRALGDSKIVLDVFKPNGEAYEATKRVGGGYLIEGSHVQVLINGRPAKSMAEVREARRIGKAVTLRMVASPGDYFDKYGGVMAVTDSENGDFRYVEDGNGELYDFLKVLRPLFTWLGRPVLYVDENGQEMLAFHAVPKTTLPANLKLPVMPGDRENFSRFKRGIFTSPIERVKINGVDAIRLKDTVSVPPGHGGCATALFER